MPLRLRRVFAKVSCSAAPARLAVTAMHLCQTCLRICTPADTAEANLLFGHRGISVSNADNNGAQLPLQARSKVCHEGRLPGIRKRPKTVLDPVKEATFRQHQANFFAGRASLVHWYPHVYATPPSALLVTERVCHLLL